MDDYCSQILCRECTQHRHAVGGHRLGGIETTQHCRLWKEYQAIHWSTNEYHVKRSASISLTVFPGVMIYLLQLKHKQIYSAEYRYKMLVFAISIILQLYFTNLGFTFLY